MPMPPYPVLCSAPECGATARFKIAARWSDGTTHELKTYFLACERCVPELLPVARAKRKTCRLTIGETLDEPAAFDLRSREPDLSQAG
jgi:hypothetical protein